MPVSIAALFITAKIPKQLKCPRWMSAEEDEVCAYTKEYYSALNKE